MVWRLASAIALCLALPAVARAQSNAHTTRAMDMEAPLKFDRITEGLPQLNVLDIVQDEKGFIWIATQEGLARHDGYDFVTYRHDPEDESSLSSNFVTALAVDDRGRLWVATGDAGLNLYDPDTDSFERFGVDAGLTAANITQIHVENDRLWILHGDLGVDILSTADDKIGSFRDNAMNDTFTAATGEGDLIWFGSRTRGVIGFAHDSGEKGSARDVVRHDPDDPNSLSSDNITALELTRDGILWIGTADAGLNRYDPKTKTVQQFRHEPGNPRSLSSDIVTFVFEDRDGNLWVGTRSGFNRFHPDSRDFTQYKSSDNPNSLSFSFVTSIFQDRGGVIWVGTFANGLNKFDPLRLQFAFYRTGSGTALSFVEGKSGTLWVGTYNAGLWKYEREYGTVTVYETLADRATGELIDLTATWITSMVVDNAGYVWLTTLGSGLVAFDPKTEQFFHFNSQRNPGLVSDELFKVESDAKGNLWIASLSAGLIYFDRASQTFSKVDAGIPTDQLFTLHLDRADPNVLWIGTGNAGLVRLDIEQEVTTTFAHDESDPKSIADNGVLDIYQAKDGTLWLGTHGGLSRFDPRAQTADNYGPDAIGSETVYGVLEDDAGRLWLSTNGAGLIRFDPKSESFEGFHRSDGLQGDEFAQGASYESRSGEMFFGGVNGFNSFFPDRISRDDYVPPVVITRFLVANEPVPLGEEIDLGYTDQVFSFEFSALAYAAPDYNRYMYKLEGFDDDWRQVDASRRFATYTNLDGGDYTFRIKGSNRHGVWSEEALAIPVSVSPAPWLSWWAYLLYAVVVVGAVLGYARYQRQRVKAVEQESRLAAVERDLELTAVVQGGFLPKSPRVERDAFRLYGFYRAADMCSGDWWWYEESVGGRHVIVVGDVTGHGPGPAMVTAAVGTAFRVHGKTSLDFDERLRILNDEVLKVGEGKYQMTMTALVLDEATGAYRLYSAGGLPLIRMGAGNDRPQVIPCRGTPLGTPEFVVGTADGQLSRGDRCILYTDGIPEIAMDNGRLLGMRRFSRMFAATRGMPLDQATAQMVTEADTVRSGRPQDDDWTFALFEVG